MGKVNYENKQYLEKLDQLNVTYYSKYVTCINKYLKNKDSRFLDVGCGNGKILEIVQEKGFKNTYGCDISELFINEAKKRGIKNVSQYDGENFPYKDKYFDVVGSFNVLEHVDDPEAFIRDQLRILRKNGYIIIACPNFLSVLFMNNHRRLRGFRRKIGNLLIIASKLISSSDSFERMRPVIRKKFEYDDDAIVITNLIDLKNILRQNNCTIEHESGFVNFDSVIYRLINSIPVVRYMLPSCFVVARKT